MNWTHYLLITLSVLTLSCNKKKNIDHKLSKAADNAGTWCYIKVPEMCCRDGSRTGIGVRMQPDSKKLLIYMEGGGGCFNTTTCAANPFYFNKTSFIGRKTTLNIGIFSKSNDNNPFKDWNFVYIPYCTGDVHGGTNNSADLNKIYKNLNMVGYNNVEKALEVLTPYFDANNPIDEVVLTGSSAGGYGVLANANQVIEAFPDAKSTIIDDSGPIMISQDVQPDCLDQHWEDLFGFYVPSDFDQYTTGQYTTNMKSMYEYLSNKHPNVQFGIISALEDAVIRAFFAYGRDNCAKLTSEEPGVLSGEVYRNGLEHLRDSVFTTFPAQNWKTYYVDNASHTFNNLPWATNNLSVNGITYFEWINQLRERTATDVYE